MNCTNYEINILQCINTSDAAAKLKFVIQLATWPFEAEELWYIYIQVVPECSYEQMFPEKTETCLN
jgi:hypothetical protein